jgi:hypothetical protein
VTKAPWDYLFLPFTTENFQDIFHPTWIASAVLLVALVVLYAIRTRALHRHPPYLDMYEWLLWTGLITFSLLVVAAIFRFEFFLVLSIAAVGLGVLVWVRFRKFPPLFAVYEQKLAKQRYFSRTKFARPEATIRTKGTRRSRRRR